jgi:hypothetical protein
MNRGGRKKPLGRSRCRWEDNTSKGIYKKVSFYVKLSRYAMQAPKESGV